eukprot:1661661-Alexandrium_andersonii.AAC.1
MAQRPSDMPIRDLLLKYANASTTWTEQNKQEMLRLCEACKAFFQREAECMVRASNGAPILVSYSSDGTPLSTRQHIRAKVGQQK